MRGPLLALWFVALSFGWSVFFGAGARLADWHAALLFLGATALFYWTFRSGQTPPPLPVWHAIALWALPLYAAFQLIPLPPVLLESLSPARALITESLGGIVPYISRAPISIAPAASLLGLFSLLAYLATFSLLRDIGWRCMEIYPWIPALPLVVIGTVEALIGIGQWLSGPPNTPVTGTFLNGEHFSALLELALPFTLVFGFISFRRHQLQDSASLKPALLAATAWGASLVLLVALFHASSLASRTIVTASLYILLAFALIPRLKTKRLRWYGAGGAAGIAILALLLVVSPPDFVESLARLASGDRPVTTLAIWNSAATLFGDYRWLGTGLGGFASTFLKYQGSTDLSAIQNPGNDVLALLISFGVVGFVIVVLALAGIAKPAIAGAVYLTNEPRRLLAVSVTASFFAALLRCGLEASLSVPAIAMAFAWLAGISQSSGLE